MCEEKISQDIVHELCAAGVEYREVEECGLMAQIAGRRGDNGRCVLLYADEYYWDKVLMLTVELQQSPDFEGTLFVFFPYEDFEGALEQSLFGGRTVVAAVLPTENFGFGQSEAGFCVGKFLASKDEFTIAITPEKVGGHAVVDNQVVAATADLVLRLHSYGGSDCQMFIENMVAQSDIYTVPHRATVSCCLNCMKEGVRSNIKDMMHYAVAELEYKYDVAIEVKIAESEPCVENDVQLTYEAMLLAKSEGYEVREMEPMFQSHNFGYCASLYPSLMYHCGVGDKSDGRELLRSLLLNILNK